MPYPILEDLFSRAGQPPAGHAITFAGEDPVLPTSFRMGELGAASIAAAALQAGRVLEQRTGRSQAVGVDVDAAAAAMRSWRYVHPVPRVETGPPPRSVAFYRTRDERWIFLHRMAPHHFARQLEVLGCDRSEEALTAAIRTWDAAELEEAIMTAGACAAMVRTHEEWAQLEQAKALAALPLFSITRTGDSEPEPAGRGERPLGGVRVLDVTRVLAGPTCARTLAEHGADVLRISSPMFPDNGQMIQDTGHGKRSTVLDLRSSDGAAALRRLVAGADVFSQGYRPGAMDRLGFSPEELAELRPGIVSVSISAFGSAGPWADRRGFDSVVQSASGMSHEESSADGMPHSLPANPLDYVTGYLAAFLVGVALERRAVEGGSWHVELSLAQTGRYLVDLGRVDRDAAASRPAELPAERLDALMTTRETGYGTLRHLAPAARMSLTPPRWELPTVPADHDAPAWW